MSTNTKIKIETAQLKCEVRDGHLYVGGEPATPDQVQAFQKKFPELTHTLQNCGKIVQEAGQMMDGSLKDAFKVVDDIAKDLETMGQEDDPIPKEPKEESDESDRGITFYFDKGAFFIGMDCWYDEDDRPCLKICPLPFCVILVVL